jgi:hypothetical protein
MCSGKPSHDGLPLHPSMSCACNSGTRTEVVLAVHAPAVVQVWAAAAAHAQAAAAAKRVPAVRRVSGSGRSLRPGAPAARQRLALRSAC